MLRRGVGPLGRGGARRRTRRRMNRRTSMMMMSAQQKQQIQKQTGKNPEAMSDDELDDAMEKQGIKIDTDSQVEQLEKLGALKEKGILTDQEFETKKAQILASP